MLDYESIGSCDEEVEGFCCAACTGNLSDFSEKGTLLNRLEVGTGLAESGRGLAVTKGGVDALGGWGGGVGGNWGGAVGRGGGGGVVGGGGECVAGVEGGRETEGCGLDCITSVSPPASRWLLASTTVLVALVVSLGALTSCWWLERVGECVRAGSPDTGGRGPGAASLGAGAGGRKGFCRWDAAFSRLLILSRFLTMLAP